MNQIQKTFLTEVENSENHGHTYITRAELIDRCSKRMKNPPPEILHNELSELIREKKLAQEASRPSPQQSLRFPAYNGLYPHQ